MDLDVLRALVLVAMLAVPAAHDISSRTVPRDVMALCGIVSACFFAYGVLCDIKGDSGYDIAWYAFAALGVAFGALAARLGVMGAADGCAIAISSAMMPYHDGIPVALAGTVMGLGCMGALAVSQNILYNLQDIRCGRPHCAGVMIALRHIKRAGEKFAVSSLGLQKAAVAEDGAVKNGSGEDYFAPADAQGMPVCSAMPAAAFIAAGLAAACALALI